MTSHVSPRRLSATDDMAPVLRLIQTAFAGMTGRIDPPSSMHNLTLTDLAEQARLGEIWVIGDRPDACVLLTPHSDHLYVGKLATQPDLRGQGHARVLMSLASDRAKALNLPALQLEVRIELTENHAFFHAMGFHETGRTAHQGFDRPTAITFSKGVPQ